MIRLYKTDIPYKFVQEPKKKINSKKKSGSRNAETQKVIIEIEMQSSLFGSFRKKWIITELKKVIIPITVLTSGGIITFCKIGSSPKKDKYFNVSITKVKGKPIISYNGKSGSIDDIVLRLYKDGADSLYTVRCMSNIKAFKNEEDYLKDRKKNVIMSFAKTMKGANGFNGAIQTGSAGILMFDGKSTYRYNRKTIAKSEKEFIEWGIKNISVFNFPTSAFGYGFGKELNELNTSIKHLERMSVPSILIANIEARKNASIEQQDAFIQKQVGIQNREKMSERYIGDGIEEDQYYFKAKNIFPIANPRAVINGDEIPDRQLMFVSEKGVEHFMRRTKKLTSLSFLNKKVFFFYIFL
jgi:hypothetical protein